MPGYYATLPASMGPSSDPCALLQRRTTADVRAIPQPISPLHHDLHFHSRGMRVGFIPPVRPAFVSCVSAAADARERSLVRRHHEWRQKRQDILVVFTGTVVREVKSGAKRVFENAGRFGIATRGRPERRKDLPRGHPPILGIEHVDHVVIMTIMLHCSMAQVVELLESDMPEDMSVVPIPSERCKVR